MPKMALDAVNLANLSDGYVAQTVDAELRKIVADLDQRGHDGVKRRLLIEFAFTDEGGGKVDIQPKVQAKLPPYVPPSTQANLNHQKGRLEFRDDSASNPDQPTINDLDGQRRAAGEVE